MPRPQDPLVSTGRVGLVVGRFQPPHRGHLPLLWAAAAACDLVVVGIGSSERHGTWEDPLTFEERAACLRAVLGDRMRPVALNDIGSTLATADWADYVLARIAKMGLPSPTDVFAPRRAEAKWYAPRFAPLDGHGVEDGGLRRFEREGRATHVLDARADAMASASEVRTLAMQGDPEWEALVPARMKGIVSAAFARLRG
jgi:cytidyltransferase-like protein